MIERGKQWEAKEAEIAGWELLEQAELLLYPDVDETMPLIPPIALEKKTPLFVVGDVVKVNRSFLGSTPGQLAVVYENYAGGGASLITSTGNDLGGFSLEDQQQFLTFSHRCKNFDYNFASFLQLQRDWQRGLFLGVFRLDEGTSSTGS